MTKTIILNEKEIPVYCTLEEAEQYFSERFDSSIWNDTTETDKLKALVEATRKLNGLKYKGFPVSVEQQLAFPRYIKVNHLSKRSYTSEAKAITVHGKNLIYIEQPEEMKMACCEEAASIIENHNSVHIRNQKMGIQSINIGAGTVSYNGSYGFKVCPEAISFIEKFLISTARVV